MVRDLAIGERKKGSIPTYLDGVQDDMDIVDDITGLSALLHGWS